MVITPGLTTGIDGSTRITRQQQAHLAAIEAPLNLASQTTAEPSMYLIGSIPPQQARHGTTLSGLMQEHGIDPWHFLDDVHDIDTRGLAPAPDLANAITALPGRRIVFTNGDSKYAGRVLAARGLETVFDAVYGIEHAQWRPKPEAAAFERILTTDRIDPKRAAMFEDDARNLEVPHQMGLRTVLVAPEPMNAAHIHHHTDDLLGFLSQIVGAAFSGGTAAPTSEA